MTKRNYQRGFTLVELLVVITIIALITTIGLVIYQSSVRKGRDGRRQTDLEQIRSALELYRSDIGNYPADLSPLSPNYLQVLPSDPKGNTYKYAPASGATPITYSLCAHLEASSDQTTDNCGGGCTGVCNYRVQNP